MKSDDTTGEASLEHVSSATARSVQLFVRRMEIARRLLEGEDRSKIISAILGGNESESALEEEIDDALRHPYLRVAQGYARSARKAYALLNLYSRLNDKFSRTSKIEEIDNLTYEQFLSVYYCRNVPFIVRKGASNWPAVRKWSRTYLSEFCGSAKIEYLVGEQRYKNEGDNTRKTTLSEFLESIPTNSVNNSRYLVATNFAFRSEGMRSLLSDIGGFRWLPTLDHTNPSVVRLWIGPAGTVTPLHHDLMSVIFVQIHGQKRFVIAPAYELPKMRNNQGVYAGVDPLGSSHEQNTSGISWRRTTVDAGDVLFIPVGWWHWVEALSFSISINFADFEIKGSVDRWCEE